MKLFVIMLMFFALLLPSPSLRFHGFTFLSLFLYPPQQSFPFIFLFLLHDVESLEL